MIKGVKHKDFLDWSEVAKLLESRDHLVLEGCFALNKIRKIKENMNSYRI